MTRVQMLILAGLLLVVLGVFCVGAVLARSVLLTPPGTAVAEEPPPEATPATPPNAQPPAGTNTPVLIFTRTATPTPIPRSPTATNTRVVNDTATPTITL